MNLNELLPAPHSIVVPLPLINMLPGPRGEGCGAAALSARGGGLVWAAGLAASDTRALLCSRLWNPAAPGGDWRIPSGAGCAVGRLPVPPPCPSLSPRNTLPRSQAAHFAWCKEDKFTTQEQREGRGRRAGRGSLLPGGRLSCLLKAFLRLSVLASAVCWRWKTQGRFS